MLLLLFLPLSWQIRSAILQLFEGFLLSFGCSVDVYDPSHGIGVQYLWDFLYICTLTSLRLLCLMKLGAVEYEVECIAGWDSAVYHSFLCDFLSSFLYQN